MRLLRLSGILQGIPESLRVVFSLFFFYEWEHRTGTMCPFSSLHPSRNGKEGSKKNKKVYKIFKKCNKKIMPSGP